ncbi:MAG: Type IV secretory pathway, VirB4 component [Candidatus Accumulibacter appositus]|uniref:Type IV secretory pathway, VirB4 component n=1 Tax=Candidatus Accumulibacter appositus TaxID=1454003 RepID=A0A011P9S3_9PROT|nr:MAG: Type IV secretory pathway, VirB4 component [Candidatus Accumulibacter appositus]
MSKPLAIAKHEDTELALLPALANRHGLITGATGTGKTVTLQVLAERFSEIGVPVFMADVKGDLSGLAAEGSVSTKMQARLDALGIKEHTPSKCPVAFWDVFGEQGHPVRATISDMGPVLLARLLNLNDTQTGVLQMVFRIADDNGLLLLDLKDLRAMLQHVGENAKTFSSEYGIQQRVRQCLGGVDRRHPARPAEPWRPGRRRLLRRTDARHRRPDADRQR